ncbi:MAG: RIP metalloprotease RseP [Burkholderiaceae bacterium]|nr:RIP metalloprotease RseP [Burkholderiaceae bacterium]
MLTLVAFAVGMGALIAFHEFGHYRVARWCGVKVLRFSIGFGKPLLRWRKDANSTEFVLCALPLGGYVHMLDEREAPVPADQRHVAFNNQSLGKRAAIVAAGPAANALLAVLLYACVQWWGVSEHRAILSQPPAASLASIAGFQAADQVRGVRAVGSDDMQEVRSFQALRWELSQAISKGTDIELGVAINDSSVLRWRLLPVSRLPTREPGALAFERLGITTPFMRGEIGQVLPEGAAAAAGLIPGDVVLRVNDTPVVDAQGLRQYIQSRVDVAGRALPPQVWRVSRGEQVLELLVQPQPYLLDAQQIERMGLDPAASHHIGRIGAYIGVEPESCVARSGGLEGRVSGAYKAWDVARMSLRMLGQMVVGQSSLSNLSGPLTIAEVAGQSASVGLAAYLSFLGLISVSLAVLNLLPIPVLDGGHLMYYLWEWVTGKPVTPQWMAGLTRGGMAVLFSLMAVALFNDIARIAS